MSKILYLSNVDRRFAMMKRALLELQQEGLLAASSSYIKLEPDTLWTRAIATALAEADIIILKWMGGNLEGSFFRRLLKQLREQHKRYYIDAAGSEEGELYENITPEQLTRLKAYAFYNGMQNFKNMLLYSQYLCDGKTAYGEPDPLHWCGIFHPRATRVYESLEEYQRDFCKPDRPNIGVVFYRDEWIWGDLAYQTALVKEIEAQGMNALCIFSNGMPMAELGMPTLVEVFEKYFRQQGKPLADVIINTMKFSLTNSRTLTGQYLIKQNIPCLQAYTLLTAYEDWKDNLEGMNAMEISISVTLPEFDGAIHGVPVSTKCFLEDGDIRYLPMAERITSMVAKAGKWARLRHKPNRDKRVAIVFHNYPPKNSNIGSAVGMDTIESVRLLMERLQQEGYSLGRLPKEGKELIEQLTANATNDVAMLTEAQLEKAQKLGKGEYLSLYNRLDPKTRAKLEADWGPAPGQVMAYEDRLLVPGTLYNNLFITMQPPRGFGEDPAKIYHSPFSAPTHHYLGFYSWIRDIWQADAVIHVGTHGSLEWLPGKNAGLASTCYPDMALGDLPNIYPYLITITGEGIQAKRRGSACLIEHLPPPQTQAGTYDQLEELEKLLDEYSHFATTEPENLEHLQEMLLNKVQEANLQQEVPYDSTMPFQDYYLALHSYLTDLKNMQVRTGLHILGQCPRDEGLIDYLQLITRLSNGSVPSLMEVLALAAGYDLYQLMEQAGVIDSTTGKTYGRLVDAITLRAKELLGELAAGAFRKELVPGLVARYSRGTEPQNLEQVQQSLEQVCSYICTTLYPNLLKTSQEIDNIVRALQGEYIEPGPSGAPSSGGADLLPTGRNFYGVDTRALPTPAAWSLGKALGDEAISRFISEEGHYPESVGIVLWSGANMRSHGQCIAEFLYLMGVKPVWQRGSQRIRELEIIPLEQLQRPRIDVTARISGLFRDTMPSVAELLDKAVLMVGALEEAPEDNYVRKHILEETAELEGEGLSPEKAYRQAAFRIFGDELGTYGAGVAALLEAKNWETVEDIAKVFIRWGGHAYGGATRGEYLPRQLERRMSKTELTIKNEDNHETNMLSSDDYNAYHGGMIATVRSIRGKAPRSYCGDSTNRARVQLHSVQEQAKRIFRSEAINPRFIEGMMEHGYKGAADLSSYVAHSFQWDATSEVMEDWMYEKYAEKYALDPKMQQWFREVNPWALQRVAEVLLEAEQRHMWQAKPETKEQLQRLLLNIEGDLEERSEE